VHRSVWALRKKRELGSAFGRWRSFVAAECTKERMTKAFGEKMGEQRLLLQKVVEERDNEVAEKEQRERDMVEQKKWVGEQWAQEERLRSLRERDERERRERERVEEEAAAAAAAAKEEEEEAAGGDVLMLKEQLMAEKAARKAILAKAAQKWISPNKVSPHDKNDEINRAVLEGDAESVEKILAEVEQGGGAENYGDEGVKAEEVFEKVG
jgi:hypothetical protein